MAFALIRTASRPLLSAGDDGAHGVAASPAEADHAAAVLRADYERWSRWALGVVGFVLTVAGGFVAAGLAATIAALGRATAADVIVTVLAGLVALAGAALLVALWRSGRALATAASHWLRAPYAGGRRTPRAIGWVQARTVSFEPRIFVRLCTATLALLVGVGGTALFAYDLGGGGSLMTISTALVGVTGALSGLGQFGGVLRIVNGVSARDPLWSRLSGSAGAR